MRCMLKVEFSTDKANQAAQDDKLSERIQPILDTLKPEAAYFTESNQRRAGFIFFDLADIRQIAGVAEPWMRTLDATVELQPVVSYDELRPRATRAAAK